jgi:hypothetical protein
MERYAQWLESHRAEAVAESGGGGQMELPGGAGSGETGNGTAHAPHKPRQKKTIVTDYPPEFEKFWAVYPRRVAKRAALEMFNRAVNEGVVVEKIVAAAQRFAGAMAKEGRPQEKMPHPATWLSGARWEDEAAATQPKAPPMDKQVAFIGACEEYARLLSSPITTQYDCARFCRKIKDQWGAEFVAEMIEVAQSRRKVLATAKGS